LKVGNRRFRAALAIAGVALLIRQGGGQGASAPTEAFKAAVTWGDAKPVLDAFQDRLPGELKGRRAAELKAAWPGWVARSNAEVRARLAQGDEDSIVNFWLYGTSFTTLPRVTGGEVAKLGPAATRELLPRRLNDLLAGAAAPGSNDRLRFVREVIARQGINLNTAAGHDQAWDYMIDLRERAIADNERYLQAGRSAQRIGDDGARQSAFATLLRDRGLSSDTRIDIDFSLDRALDTLAAKGTLAPRSVRRIAIVGPGLDFTDKAEGYDFYPLQTIQPFAVLDSVTRLGLADTTGLQMATFDLSQRVNRHIEAARGRAQAGAAYVLQLPLPLWKIDRDTPGMVAYWRSFGAKIGDEVPALTPPATANVRVRALRVRPEVVLSIKPRDLNIVLERLAPLKDEDRFDLIVATNVLVYYDAFEQALALANIAAMLRPGGVFLTNYKVAPLAPLEAAPSLISMAALDRQGNGDTIFGYLRR
jgi:SAM-dependent methyltransferase